MAEEPLLTVRELVVRFESAAGTVRAVDAVDLDLRAGETLALVGESGCGKSTLARAIVGLVPALAGSVRLAGRELLGLSRRARRRSGAQIQMVFQDPHASLNPRITVANLLAESVALHGPRSGAVRDQRVCELLERVGLDPALRHRYPHSFSGGQCQRIAIARALAAETPVLLCDEVTSALDVSIQSQILNLLGDLRRDLGIALLFISHDLAVVRQVSDRVSVMYLGQIVETRETGDLFGSPAHPYTRALLEALPRIGGTRRERDHRVRGDVPSPMDPPAGCRFHPRCPEVFERCVRERPVPVAIGRGSSRCFLSEAAQSKLDTQS